jgi:hypothetical protein
MALHIIGRGGRDLVLVPEPSRGASCKTCDRCDFAVSVMSGGGCTSCPLCTRDIWDEDAEVDDFGSDMVFFCADCGVTFDYCCSHNEDVTYHAKFITAVVDRKTGERFEGMPVFRSEIDCYHLLKDTWKPIWRCTCRGACNQRSHGHWGGNGTCCKPRDMAAVVIQRCFREWLRRRREAVGIRIFKRNMAKLWN